MTLKKVIAVVASFVMVGSLAACGGGNANTAASSASAAASSAAASSAEEETTAASSAAEVEETAAASSAASSVSVSVANAAPIPEGDIIIGYNAYGDISEFSQEVTNGMNKFAEEYGYQVLRADTGGDAATANSNVDSFLLQGANVIVDCSWTTDAVKAVADKCKENNVLCLVLDMEVDEPGYYVGVDNYEVGATTAAGAAEWIKANWDGKLDYILIAFNESFGDGVRPRVGEIPGALAAEGIEVPDENVIWVDPASSDATAACKQLGTDFLTAHPDGEHILMCGANDLMGQGFLAAAETANRTENCAVVTNDLTSVAISNLYQDNIFIGSTGFFPELYGQTVMETIKALVDGEEVPHEVHTAVIYANRDNIADYYPNPN